MRLQPQRKLEKQVKAGTLTIRLFNSDARGAVGR